MKTLFIISLLICFCVSANVAAQSTVEKCFQKPTAIFLESQDSTTSSALKRHLKLAKAELAPDEKVYFFLYSQGSWGTGGLRTVGTSVKNLAKSVLLKKRFVVIEAGYKNEASVDIFRLKKECQKLVWQDYKGDPEMSREQVDFSDAPLGLSVFPSQSQLKDLISKTAPGVCEGDCRAYVTCFVIVGIDGRVINSWPEQVFIFSTDGDVAKLPGIAIQALVNWAFKPIVIDGTPRYIRGRVTVVVADTRTLEFMKIKRKSDEKKSANQEQE